MTGAPKRFPLGLDDLVRVPAKGSKTAVQGGAGEKVNIGAKTATRATVAHAGFDTRKPASVAKPAASRVTGTGTSGNASSPLASKPVARPASSPAASPMASKPAPKPAPKTGSEAALKRAIASAAAPLAREANERRAVQGSISAEQRLRAAAIATEHAKPGDRVRAPAPPPVSTPRPPEPVPPRVVRPVAAALKPAVTAGVVRAMPTANGPAHFSLTSERVRERMVERVRASGVSDSRVLAAMAAVPRHLFVDPGFATQAYEEAALPIGHHQTISKPSVVARMIELACNGRALENVLEIGTGCGYQAAVLSGVAREVYSIERIRPLYERAKQNLRPLRIRNIRLHYGDGRLGLSQVAPFDAIVIAAAGLDVPQALLEQLQIGGRLIAPVGAESQVLTLVERVAENQWHESQLDRVFFVPLKSGVI